MDDLICISHLRWDFVWQRPQHLLSRLATQHRVLFVEEPMTNTNIASPYLEILPGKGAPNVTVLRLIQPTEKDYWVGHGDSRTQNTYADLLRQYLITGGFNDPILWLYTPMASDFIEVINPRLLIVDVMDQLSAFKGAPTELIEREKSILKKADIVFTGGASLYRDKLPFNPNTHLFPSGVEIAHYEKAAHPESFAEPAELINVAHPILGYFGVIDERMDLALLAHVAQAQPEWSIVMIGPIAKISREELPHAPNIHYLGMKSYEELPAYLSRFDVAMIPFALNESTRFLSPTKTLEYMAAHKPIVSTPINDVIELYGEVVHVARTADEFVSRTKAALKEDGEHRRENEQRLLTENAWDAIAAKMEQIIYKSLAAKKSDHVDRFKGKTKAA